MNDSYCFHDFTPQHKFMCLLDFQPSSQPSSQPSPAGHRPGWPWSRQSTGVCSHNLSWISLHMDVCLSPQPNSTGQRPGPGHAKAQAVLKAAIFQTAFFVRSEYLLKKIVLWNPPAASSFHSPQSSSAGQRPGPGHAKVKASVLTT